MARTLAAGAVAWAVLGGAVALAASACPPGETMSVAQNGALALTDFASRSRLRVLAIGSSSTEGVGATAAQKTYPAQLATDLIADGWAGAEVRNAGIGGEIAEATLARLKRALASGWPQLVIWQVGTNDGLVGVDAARFRALVEEGVRAAHAASVPIVLVDPQFTAGETNTPHLRRNAEIVDAVGEAQHAPVVRRYDSMRALAAKDLLASFMSKDGLHMDDLGYACLAAALARVIEAGGIQASGGKS